MRILTARTTTSGPWEGRNLAFPSGPRVAGSPPTPGVRPRTRYAPGALAGPCRGWRSWMELDVAGEEDAS